MYWEWLPLSLAQEGNKQERWAFLYITTYKHSLNIQASYFFFFFSRPVKVLPIEKKKKKGFYFTMTLLNVNLYFKYVTGRSSLQSSKFI